jgi:hypothetical protein
MLQEASQHFTKASAPHLTRECLLLARVVGLQAQLPVTILNLDTAQVEAFLETHPQLLESAIVAQFYDREALVHWVKPVYQQVCYCVIMVRTFRIPYHLMTARQVVAGGNFRYWDQFSQAYMVDPTFFRELVHFFKKQSLPTDEDGRVTGNHHANLLVRNHLPLCSTRSLMP